MMRVGSTAAMVAAIIAAVVCAAHVAMASQCVGGPCSPAHQQVRPPAGECTATRRLTLSLSCVCVCVQCGAPFVNAPQFHVMDLTCGENDPNGMWLPLAVCQWPALLIS